MQDLEKPSVRDVLEAVDEFLEQGIRSGGWEGRGGTSSSRSTVEEAAVLRAHLGRIMDAARKNGHGTHTRGHRT
jgi:hypothetical protein